ncbi:hypothetical protein EVAR_68717_1 [Eumeta japonica]|uniref:Uncharacterized protein n=1 Tax=Eumeta variegata TaxID=151549 RepID=A0A4C2A5K5_EUMVA|nr:hypothetical protein EVAR_68717_1 [Eumeta japonica]
MQQRIRKPKENGENKVLKVVIWKWASQTGTAFPKWTGRAVKIASHRRLQHVVGPVRSERVSATATRKRRGTYRETIVHYRTNFVRSYNDTHTRPFRSDRLTRRRLGFARMRGRRPAPLRGTTRHYTALAKTRHCGASYGENISYE